jgi:hypothetical protein
VGGSGGNFVLGTEDQVQLVRFMVLMAVTVKNMSSGIWHTFLPDHTASRPMQNFFKHIHLLSKYDILWLYILLPMAAELSDALGWGV